MSATSGAEVMETEAIGIVTPDSKLDALRAKMKEVGVDVYLVPSDDPHLSEYVPTAYMRRAYLSNFRGSAGTAVVTQDGALLWTDSRYFNEAGLQLDANHWTLMKQGEPKVPTMNKYLADMALEKFKEGKGTLKVGIDPYVHSANFAKELTEAFATAAEDLEDRSIQIGQIDTLDQYGNLIDPIWGDERPPVPTSPFRVHPMEYAGVSVQDKVAKIRSEMGKKKATLSVFAAMDDVAYLFNMRAMGDVATCPVGIAYATVSHDEAILYCDSVKLEAPGVKEHLSEAGVTVRPYDQVIPTVETHGEIKGNKVWIDKSRANYALSRVIPDRCLLDSQNAITPMKACKNANEMEGMRQAHIVDGAAMAHFISWLEDEVAVKGNTVSEVEVDLKVTACRAKQPGFLEVSFPTIAGVGSNGAITHYTAEEGDLMKYLDKENPILIDSGGQYTYGTTDVTRTWHFGKPTDVFADAYTRVLKGNIGVDSMIFPENTPGFVLDVFARKALWAAGMDYGHGTGHGVGAALNVHEGPHGITPRWANLEVLKKGMVVSNEPGYYVDGSFGIRIENLLEISYVKEEDNMEPQNGEQDAKSPSGKKFLKFKNLTLIPIQKNFIKMSLMTKEDMDWLDAYHALVLEKIKPLLEEGSPAMAW
eukprot:CAMPEP_0198282826 /NCGR_PEP_ID=MMETSP1449-20131203/2578_1 /TAXON_ID=420275 /ORGANISM="Attheya septentrionalis, Strain CCMP2084" /LENGTH=646 /DNA_ID=CAMNT_0043979241 /DNA_START=289 /DNA_END=2226 /DNA_ORIENTATION=+